MLVSVIGVVLTVLLGFVVTQVTGDSSDDKAEPSPTASATPQEPTLQPSQPTTQPSTPPPPTTSTPVVPVSDYGSVKEHPTFTIGSPRISCGRTQVNLDLVGQVGGARVNGDSDESDELSFGNCSPGGLAVENSAQVGSSGKTRPPTAEKCAQDAATQAIASNIAPDDLTVGQAFCAVTDEQAVVWMRLTNIRKAEPNLPSLVFQVAVWPHA